MYEKVFACGAYCSMDSCESKALNYSVGQVCFNVCAKYGSYKYKAAVVNKSNNYITNFRFLEKEVVGFLFTYAIQEINC